ncbi:HAD-IIB family hydrolase [Terribacillus sp. 179-K 1B1 HS]|uniref:HAD-IIB family hydrolase n=1 Tax=Terribacillus sp. 179-K 1B1 HS TaxID=3142388 RepID=UPI00399F6C51
MYTKRCFASTDSTKALICFDFDETYFPHACEDGQLKDLHAMELYLNRIARQHHVKIAWVTGSDCAALADKMERAHLTYMPHFIAANLGTELYQITADGELKEIYDWRRLLPIQEEFNQLVDGLIHQLSLDGTALQPQTSHGQSAYKKNFYYFPDGDDMTGVMGRLRRAAAAAKIGLNVNACNPRAGDPNGAYDVDFIPLRTGKRAAVQFLANYCKVEPAQIYAFGDSGNDLEMLQYAGHGFLVANATEEAKQKHSQMCRTPYAAGIQSTLKHFFS